MKVLFIVKKRLDSYGVSTGLLNSARFVAEALPVCSTVVEAVDGNDIDRLVTRERPDVAIIEAIWVTPGKLAELVKLHPRVRWVVRVHSKMPFLAEEGMALGWIKSYANIPGVILAANSLEMVGDLRAVVGACSYLPNIYLMPWGPRRTRPMGRVLDVGCFGAIRPLKNTLTQAVAALGFARSKGAEMRFHVNAGRVEQRGENVLKNLRALLGGALIEHPWLDHNAFLALVRTMDVGMQVSLTESFNIVTADMVGNGIPVVASREVDWLPTSTVVMQPTSTHEIRGMLEAVTGPERADIARLQSKALAGHNRSALLTWERFLSSEKE